MRVSKKLAAVVGALLGTTGSGNSNSVVCSIVDNCMVYETGECVVVVCR